MDWLDALILGLVQGLTEFLPISSSGHLRFVGDLIGNSDPGAAFTAITQIGTELAVLIYFWKDIIRIVKRWWFSLPIIPASKRLSSKDPDARLGWMIILGSIPIGILGLLFQDWIDTTLRNLWITVAMLIFFGILLGVVDKAAASSKSLREMTWGDAIGFGLAQAMALIPGVSRSGGTITAGRALGFTREAAARYSFLLAMPAVFASGLYKVFQVFSGGDTIYVGPTILATVVAFAVGFLVIMWFLKLISNHSFMPFVWYRICLGIFIAICLLCGWVSPTSGSF